MENKKKLVQYFEAFSNKDIVTLEKMFSDDVTLKDWEVFACGKDEVIDANKNIFNSVDTIKVTPLEFYFNSDKSYAVLISINVNESEIIKVIDVVKFNSNNLIVSIEAFKYED